MDGGQFNLLGTFDFLAGTEGDVVLSAGSDGVVIADAVRFVLVEPGTVSTSTDPVGDWIAGSGKDYLDIISASVSDQGTNLLFSMDVNGAIPDEPPQAAGFVWHLDLNENGTFNEFPPDINVRVAYDTANGWQGFLDDDIQPPPDLSDFDVAGDTVSLRVAKDLLGNPQSFNWEVGIPIPGGVSDRAPNEGFATWPGKIKPKAFFADEVILINDPNHTPDEGPTSSMLGPPDGRYIDLDGGGTTLGFSDNSVEFNLGVAIPSGTQLIIVTLAGSDNVFGEVTWGYGTPNDNGDGVASNPTGATQFLETTTISPNPWGGEFPAKFLFYTFDGTFDGVAEDFFLSLDDLADTEIDAVQIVEGR